MEKFECPLGLSVRSAVEIEAVLSGMLMHTPENSEERVKVPIADTDLSAVTVMGK